MKNVSLKNLKRVSIFRNNTNKERRKFIGKSAGETSQYRSIDFKFILALFVRDKNSLEGQEIVSSVTGHCPIVGKLLIRFLF